MNAPLLAVDSASLYFRAFHGIPESAARTPDGQPVNAVRGIIDMLAQLIRTRRPDRVVCALDADWRPKWRVDLIPSYKLHRVAAPLARPAGLASAGSTTGQGRTASSSGQREAPFEEEIPDTLAPQVPMIIEVLAAVGIATYGVPGYEADDVLGTLAARSTTDAPVEVVSGDRDLFQLVDDARGVRFLYCGRGVAKLEDCDEAAVLAKYGVPAQAYADFAALRGDPSDGLPGVPGVGDKTAMGLVNRFGNLAGIRAAALDGAADLATGLRKKILDAGDYLDVALKVVRVADDVPLPDVDPALPREPVDAERLLELAEAWNLAGSCKRLVDALTER